MKRVALVTGVAGGIGRATAALLRECGWHVVGVDIAEGGEDTDRFIRMDVGATNSPQHLLEGIRKDEGRLDALVNNAAVQLCKPLVDTTPEEWDEVLAVNLRAMFLLARSAFPLLREAGGAIVNVGSVHALATSGGVAAYAASKGGGVALTRSLAIEMAPLVRVNAVLPGAVNTEMLKAGFERGHLPQGSPGEKIRQLAQRTVLQRVGEPREIAQAILFLASMECSSFITGQTLVVDGGATARLSTE